MAISLEYLRTRVLESERRYNESCSKYDMLAENIENGTWDDVMIYDFLSDELGATGIDTERMTFERCDYSIGKVRYRVSADGKTIYIIFNSEDDAKKCESEMSGKNDDEYKVDVSKERPKTIEVTLVETHI